MTLPETPKTRYNIHDENIATKISDEIPAFLGWEGSIDIKQICQYLVLMYDPDSPMRREVANYMQRKSACAELVGFPKTGKKWSEEAEKILLGQNQDFNVLKAGFLSSLAIPEYTELIILLEIQRRRSIDVLNGEITDKTHAIMQSITQRINSLTSQLFGSGEEDEVEAVRRALYMQINVDKLRIRPEDVVDQFNEEGNLDDFSPYGEDYVVEEMHFIDDEEPQS